jgi:hypothetical protein
MAPFDTTHPHIQVSSVKNISPLHTLPAYGRLKELCEQFEKGNCTTITMTDTCAIKISALSSNQLSSGSNKPILQKEAA